MANNTGIKYGGRQKGTPNKATARLREAFTDLLEDNMGIQTKWQKRSLRRR